MKRNLFILIMVMLTTATTLSAQEQTTAPRLKVMGYGQVYAEGAFPNEGKTLTTFGINKFEMLWLGQITDQWSFGATVQFNKPVMLKDLYMQYAFMPQLKVKIGQFKTPFGHENQVAPFLNALATGGSMPTVYFAGVGMNPLYHGTAGRDIGLEVSGDLFNHLLTYKAVIMNGQGMNNLDLNKGKLAGGSLYIRPLKGLSLHTSYLGGDQVAMSAGKGLQQGESYVSHRVSAGIIGDFKPISVATEYMYGKDGKVESMGAYLTASIHLPKCYDIVVSGDYLQTNMEERATLYTTTIGVNKWLKGNSRLQLQYRYAHPVEGMTLQPKGHTVRAQFQFVF